MPSKSRDFNPDFFYHIYNCGVEKRNIFLEPYDYERFLETLSYYLYRQPISLAQAKDLSHLNPKGLGARPLGFNLEKPRLSLVAYCLMPNHFHLLVKFSLEGGIKHFISDVSNSYTRFFNIKNHRLGSLLQGPYKAKEIKDEGSLLQVARYIHLNPIMSKKTNSQGLLKKPEDYPYSSYRHWINDEEEKWELLDKKLVAEIVGFSGGKKNHKDFVEAKIGVDLSLGLGEAIIESDSHD